MHIKQERKCVACRQLKHQKEMLRIACIQKKYYIDEKQKMDGRGAYVCLNPECLTLAIKKRLFNKTFKSNIDSEFYEQLGAYEQNN